MSATKEIKPKDQSKEIAVSMPMTLCSNSTPLLKINLQNFKKIEKLRLCYSFSRKRPCQQLHQRLLSKFDDIIGKSLIIYVLNFYFKSNNFFR